jgi:pimeloyl-ACP methyl ester carboxylesterase
MPRELAKRAGGARPIVIVLPGIMGTALERGSDRIWLHYLRLMAGGLADLRDLRSAEVRATAPLDDYYGSLCRWLGETHEVEPFGYDWRQPLADSAARLATVVEAALDGSTQPVRLLAHSMGGLVARQMIQARPELWDRLCQRNGGRFVMLGTPNHGAHSTVDALLGTAATVQQLAMLDLARGIDGVLDIIQGFDGLLQLLPLAEQGRWFRRESWDQMRAASGRGARPDPGRLAAAQAALATLPEAIPHAERVL